MAEAKPARWRIVTATAAPHDEFQARSSRRGSRISDDAEVSEAPIVGPAPDRDAYLGPVDALAQ